MKRYERLIFFSIFVLFLLGSTALVVAFYWYTPSGPEERFGDHRDIAQVLDEVGGQTIQPSHDLTVSLIAGTADDTGTGAGASTESVPENGPEGSYRTDFKLDQDSFAFSNYGSTFPEGNLTIQEVH